MLHNWCAKGCGMFCPGFFCMVNIPGILLLIGKKQPIK